MTRSARLPLALFTLALAFGQDRKPLTANDLIEMKKAGFDEQTIVEAIEANGASVDTSVQGLMALKNAGLSDSVIRAALAVGNAAPARPSAIIPETGAVPEEIGLYVLKDGRLSPLPVEVAKTKTGGMLRSMATMGVSRMNINGSVSGPKSSIQLQTPVTIVLRCAEGTAPAEYQLMVLEIRKDRRQFVTGKLGFRATVGVDDKSLVAAKYERIGPNTYKAFLASLERGEYGFLAPGLVTPGSPGKLYTFGIQ